MSLADSVGLLLFRSLYFQPVLATNDDMAHPNDQVVGKSVCHLNNPIRNPTTNNRAALIIDISDTIF